MSLTPVEFLAKLTLHMSLLHESPPSSRGGRRPTWRSREISELHGIASSRSLLAMTEIGLMQQAHIPDRYQNVRRHAGFYASIVQYAVSRAAKKAGRAVDIETSAPVRPKNITNADAVFRCTLPNFAPSDDSALRLLRLKILV